MLNWIFYINGMPVLEVTNENPTADTILWNIYMTFLGIPNYYYFNYYYYYLLQLGFHPVAVVLTQYTQYKWTYNIHRNNNTKQNIHNYKTKYIQQIQVHTLEHRTHITKTSTPHIGVLEKSQEFDLLFINQKQFSNVTCFKFSSQ
jgi:hypothetical protein